MRGDKALFPWKSRVSGVSPNPPPVPTEAFPVGPDERGAKGPRGGPPGSAGSGDSAAGRRVFRAAGARERLREKKEKVKWETGI